MGDFVISPEEHANQNVCVGVTTALTALSVIIVALRTLAHGFVVRSMGGDDYLMLVALLFTIGYLASIYVHSKHGMGYHMNHVTLHDGIAQLKNGLAMTLMYYFCIYCIKVSILILYLRFAAERGFRLRAKITTIVLSLYQFSVIIVIFLQCIPLRKRWALGQDIKGRCINMAFFYWITSAFNILTDIWILALPVRVLLSIQRPRREKLALLFLFSLGIFSCIASIIRLHAVRVFTSTNDRGYRSATIHLWSLIEINVGIYCASIPSLKVLIVKSQRERTRRAAGYSHPYPRKSVAGARICENSGGLSGGIIREIHITSESFPMTSMNESNGASDKAGSQEVILCPEHKPQGQV